MDVQAPLTSRPPDPYSGGRAEAFVPRVLRVQLGPLGPSDSILRVDRVGQAGLDSISGVSSGLLGGLLGGDAAQRFCSWGGTALGLVLLADAEQGQEAANALVVTVGGAVSRSVPTAARASILARAPLTGLLGLGQVGGDLGAGLAAVADALVITGQTQQPGTVLLIDAQGARLVSVAGLEGRLPSERLALIRSQLGPGATLTFGPGAEKGLPFASLVAGSVAQAPSSGDLELSTRPSLVGRSGLGSVLALSGLQALHVKTSLGTGGPRVTAGDVEEAKPGSGSLREALLRSPRLAQRSESGTLELFSAEAVRRGRPAELGPADSLKPAGKSGCRGCPTPCGWSFERSQGQANGPPSSQPGRFSALRALGTDIGLNQASQSLELLRRADDLAVDAKELGALLELVTLAAETGKLELESPRGDLARLLSLVDEIVLGTGGMLPKELRVSAARGAAAFAQTLQLEHATIQGATVRRAGLLARAGPDPTQGLSSQMEGIGLAGGLAAMIGQCTSAGGADPMRTFPFLVEAMDREALEEMIQSPLPIGADDPNRPEGKGLLAWWHQNLVAGLDLTGFCVFSAAGLLADRVLSLDELARHILPLSLLGKPGGAWSDLSAGQRLLSAGANIALFARSLDAKWLGALEESRKLKRGERDRPAWAARLLDHPELLPAHRQLRGIGSDGNPTRAGLSWLGSPRPGLNSVVDRDQPEASKDAHGSKTQGFGVQPEGPHSITLAAAGELARSLETALGKLDPERSGFLFEFRQPMSLQDLLETLTALYPNLETQLLLGGRPLPSIWRRGQRLRADAQVLPGDRLDFLLAIAGG